MASDFEGAKEMKARFAQFIKESPQRYGAALYQEALIVTRDSMRLTPVDTGALRASHETGKPEGRGAETSVTIKVGGPAAPYALIVHEDLEARHPVGQAKFLETAVNAARGELLERLAKRLKLDEANA